MSHDSKTERSREEPRLIEVIDAVYRPEPLRAEEREAWGAALEARLARRSSAGRSFGSSRGPALAGLVGGAAAAWVLVWVFAGAPSPPPETLGQTALAPSDATSWTEELLATSAWSIAAEDAPAALPDDYTAIAAVFLDDEWGR